MNPAVFRIVLLCTPPLLMHCAPNAPSVSSPSAPAEAESALKVLQTSLDENERYRALRVLDSADPLPEAVDIEMGKLLLFGDREYGRAVNILARRGEAAFPIIARLLSSTSLDLRMRACAVIQKLDGALAPYRHAPAFRGNACLR